MPDLSELLDAPFGPYWEEEALTRAVGNTTLKNPIELSCLHLRSEKGGETTGLTECELYQPEYDPARFSVTNAVRFTGVLQLRQREHQARLRDNPEARLGSITKLKAIYANSLGFDPMAHRVKVRIMGTKRGPVVFPHSEFVRNGLMMNSRHRRYLVHTMHIDTYQLSRLYLARFRLLTVLWELLAIDAGSKEWRDNKTPLIERTPEWFVDLYMKHKAYAGAARQHRPLYTSSDSDIEPDSNGAMKPGREHTLRHLSRAEVRSDIAQHGEWIVSEVVQRLHNKWIDVDVWQRWLAVDARRMRKQSARAHPNRRWGVWDGATVSSDDSTDEDDDGGGDEPPRPHVARQQPPPPNKHNPPNKKRSDSTPMASSSNTRTRVRPAVDATTAADGWFARDYDPDFSPPSSPADSDSDDSEPPDPDLIALLPPAFFHPPQPTHTLKWVCSVTQCRYTIDLLNLTDENLDTENISQDDKRRLRSKRWTVRDVWVREAFAYMVDKHHDQHIDEWGIKIELRDGKWTASWKDPRHPRSERLRVVRKDDRDKQVKEETT